MALTKIKADGLTADCIDETKLADNSIDSEHYNDGSIDNAHLADDAVGIAELSATGTASSSTFLRGDNSWATPTATTINNNADNRVMTGSGTANTLEGEAKFTYDGSLVTTEKRMVIGNGTDFQIPSRSSTSSYTPQFQVTGAWNDPTHGGTMALNGRTDYPLLWMNSGASYADGSGAGYIVWSIKDGAGNYCNTASIESQIDGTPGNNDSPGMLRFLTTPDGTCSPTERMRISSSGAVGINDANPSDKLSVVGTTNFNGNSYIGGDLYMYGSSYTKGIFLGGSGTANKLEDYEEGTWTPNIQQGSVNVHTANYTKIGRVVHLTGRLESFTNNSSGSSIEIGGLPFTPAVTGIAQGTVMYSYVGDAHRTVLYLHSNDKLLFYGGHSGAYDNIKHSDLNVSSGSSDIYFCVTYHAS